MTLNGRDHYLGSHGTKASRIEYDRLIGEWLVAGRVPNKPQGEISLVELAAAYKRWAATYYVKNGAATPMVGHVTLALKTVCTELGYGRTPLVEFGPLALQAVQLRLAESGRRGGPPLLDRTEGDLGWRLGARGGRCECGRCRCAFRA